MITIINYGMGNLGSLLNMFKRIGVSANIESDSEVIKASKKIVLPGVGSFDAAMNNINSIGGLREVLENKAFSERVPILGVCLGMQLLTRSSEEGRGEGLGWISAKTIRFPAGNSLKVPHMGWNQAIPTRKSELTRDLPDETRFYFVHSYYVRVDNEEDSLLKTDYGLSFDSAIQHKNIYGCQFHPEKSHKFGMKLLKNFARL